MTHPRLTALSAGAGFVAATAVVGIVLGVCAGTAAAGLSGVASVATHATVVGVALGVDAAAAAAGFSCAVIAACATMLGIVFEGHTDAAAAVRASGAGIAAGATMVGIIADISADLAASGATTARVRGTAASITRRVIRGAGRADALQARLAIGAGVPAFAAVLKAPADVDAGAVAELLPRGTGARTIDAKLASAAGLGSP